MQKTVEMYRLWQDGTWDKVTVTVFMEYTMPDDVLEARACQQAWLDLVRTGEKKPLQIGMIMSSLYGEKK
jgi:hypothetical protein